MQSLRFQCVYRVRFGAFQPPANWLYFPYRNSLFRHLIECEACWYWVPTFHSWFVAKFQQVYLEKIRVLTAGSWGVKAPLCLNNVAWNNRIRPRFYSVGLIEQQTSWLKRQKVYSIVWLTVANKCAAIKLPTNGLLPGASKSQRLLGVRTLNSTLVQL